MRSKPRGSQRCRRSHPSTRSCQQCGEHCAAWAGASSVTRAVWNSPDQWRWGAVSRLVALGESWTGSRLSFPGAQHPFPPRDGHSERQCPQLLSHPSPPSLIIYPCRGPAARASRPRRLRGDRHHHLRAAVWSRVPELRHPTPQPAPAARAGSVCCSHRLLEHGVWVSTGSTYSGGRYLAFLTPNPLAAANPHSPGLREEGHTSAASWLGPAQTLPHPDLSERDPSPPQVRRVGPEGPCPGLPTGGSGKARQQRAGCLQGEGPHPLALPFSLASPCGRSAWEPHTHPDTAPTLPELLNTHLLQTKQPELQFY